MSVLFLDSSSKRLHLGLDTVFKSFDLEIGLAEELPSCLQEVCKQEGRDISDIQALVYANGPGSFTGLRSGLSFIKGLTHLRGVPLFGVSLFLGRGYHYAMKQNMKEKMKQSEISKTSTENSFCFYLKANATEIFSSTMCLSDNLSLSSVSQIEILPLDAKENTSFISLDDESLASNSINPAQSMSFLYEKLLCLRSAEGLYSEDSIDFGEHLVQWNSNDMPPVPVYGKVVQAKTLKERGVVLGQLPVKA